MKVMKFIKPSFFILLSIYSIVLISIELTSSQDYVDLYFTDIVGPVFFYGVNTTLCTFLLWACALIFAINISFLDKQENRIIQQKQFIFYVSQILLFVYLGVDERFKIHEKVGGFLGVDDSIVLLGLAMIEMVVLIFLGNLRNLSQQAKLSVLIAAVFCALMLFIDGLVPGRLVLRLSFEDLSKTWACVFLLKFAWEISNSHITKLKQQSKATQ